MIRARRSVVVAALAVIASASSLAAQADVIRGRVTSASIDNAPVENVQVTATSLSGNVNRSAKTDRNGRYTITFPGAEGDYVVTFTAIGYAPRRFEVKRTADQDILILDARLSPTALLDTVVTVGQRNRARPARGDVTPDVSGTERSITNNLLPIDQVGDLAAMAATLPGVLFIQGVNGDPAGFSVLGLDAEQNNTTLNGMLSGASELPRDAAISVTLATSPYDVSQGQFSGGRLNLRTAPGSNYVTRSGSLLFNAPQLQWTDPRGRALGQEYTNANVGGAISGPFVYDKAFYNVSYQVGRRANDLHTLLNTDPVGLETLGVAADSLRRLLSILQGAHIPPTTPGFPGTRHTDQGLALGSLDLTPPSSATGQTFNVTFNGSWVRSSPASALSTALPASSFNATNWNGAIQFHHTSYFSFGILSETAVSRGESHRDATPYLELPSGSVLVHSDFADGVSSIQPILFGGSSSRSASSSSSLDLTNQLSWFSANNKHRVKLTSELRRDSYSVDQANNELGAFVFNSLSDVQLGRAVSFTRELTPIRSSGTQLVAGLSLGDSYRRTRDLQIVYGVRLDANRFQRRPLQNTELERAFDVRNDRVPNAVYASPRIGFSWTYGTLPQASPFSGAAALPRAVVRGGVGVFQNSLNVSLPSQAISHTGLADQGRQVTCAGTATPIPDWAAYASDPLSIPSQCTDGSTRSLFANAAPDATLFARDYVSQRSIRSNLQWSGAIFDNRFVATIGGVYSRNLNQPGFVDRNFDHTMRFTVGSEANRPVFVAATSIVPATGAIASHDGRISTAFNRVTELRSDLTSVSRQITLQVSPLSLNSQYTWGLAYTLGSVREEVSGFTSTAGNPFDAAAGRSSRDARHQILASLGTNLFDIIRVTWLQRLISGLPFTPVVAGDVNGDGYVNDRAFIAGADSPDSALAGQMQALLARSPASVRKCLRRQSGQLAARNSCDGPWTSMASMSVAFNPVRVRLPQRATVSFVIGNPLAAADLLVHGENRTHGWGQLKNPDPRLLFVRGFDPQTLRYRYEVNQRFGSTSQAVSTLRAPVTLTASLKVDVGPTRERQGLTQTLDRGRTTGGQKFSEATLKIVYGSAGIVNPMAAILRDADTLRLTAPQADSVATLNRWYIIHLDSIWTPVTQYYASLPDRYNQDEVYDRYRRAREASVDLLVRVAPDIKALLTAEQRRRLPDLIAAYLDLRYLAAIRSGTSGTPGGVFAPGAGVPGAPGGGRSG